MDPRARKQIVIAAAIFGGVISLIVSIMMDFMFSDALQGTWRDAIVHDMNHFFSITLSPDSFIVYILYVLMMILLTVIGAAIGAGFGYLIQKFLGMLTS